MSSSLKTALIVGFFAGLSHYCVNKALEPKITS